MKTHYGVLWLNLIISIIMAFSLNNFTELDLYLPVFFLYFASSLAAFFDKYVAYRDAKYSWEKYISAICIALSAVMVLLYLFHTLNYLEIYFEPVNEEIRMRVKAVTDCFYTFNSADITASVFFIAFLVPVAYSVLLIAAYLREEGYTMEILKYIFKKKKGAVLKRTLIAGVIGGLAVGYCFYKYQKKYAGYGSPQWIKYFVCLFVVSFIVELFILMKSNKDILKQEEMKEIGDEPINDLGTNLN